MLGTEGDRSRVEHALQDARGYVQHEIAKVCETRSVPHLEFVFDRSVEGAFKMERLLDDLKKERGDESAPPTDASAPDDEKPEAEKKDDDA